MALPGAVVHIRKMRCSIMCSLAKDIGIDLGTASVLVYVKGKGVVLNEPSVVAINKDDGRLLSVGADAQAMLGRTPGNIVAIRPLRDGVISDYDMTERMLKEFIRKVTGGFHHIFKPRVIICVPSGITEVEERAVVDAGIQAGAGRVYLIEEPVAAAIGAGIDITKPEGHMVVDIGGGTSDIAVISLKGVVESASIKVAGDQFNEAIVKYMRRKHNILIGERTAEQMKMQIGCVFPKEEETTIEIKGRCLLTGLPKLITVTSTEMMDAFEEPVERILEAVHNVLERTPAGAGGGHLQQRHRHDRRRQPGGRLRQAHHRPHRHPHRGGRKCHQLRGHRHRQEPGFRPRDERRHREPLPPQADELSLSCGILGTLSDPNTRPRRLHMQAAGLPLDIVVVSGFCPPMGSQERAPLYAPAVLIAGRQGKLGVPLPLPGGFLVPLGGLNEVPRHAGAVFVAASQIILRMLVAQLGGLAVPEHGLGCVLSHAFASFAANAQHILCLGVALLGGPAEPANGLGLVLLCAPAVIAEAQLILRLCIAQLRSLLQVCDPLSRILLLFS